MVEKSYPRAGLSTGPTPGPFALGVDEGAWAVLDYRVAIEAGAVMLAAERNEPEQLDA